MAQKEKLQYCLWSYNKEYINDIMIELGKKGIDSFRENQHGRYLLSVNKNKYEETLNIARSLFDPKKVGSINYYRHFRGLNNRSLVYGYIADAKKLEMNWENDKAQPRYIKEMLGNLEIICGCPLYLEVNQQDCAIEIIAKGEVENIDEAREKVISYLYEKMGDLFENIYKCRDDGKLIRKDKTRKRDTIYNLFETTFLASGMYHPGGANIVPKTDEELLTESGYKSASVNRGCQRQRQNIASRTDEKIIINGTAELYEIKNYNYTWDAVNKTQNKVLPVRSSLVDNISYNSFIIIDDKVAKVTTNYTLDRKATISRQLAFDLTFPSEVSVRNGLLPYPLKTGNYSGIIEEYYMHSTDGTKLVHFATHSPYFEIFDIPVDFDFVKNNTALKKASTVYDIRDYNPKEPELQSVRNIIDETIKQLMLSNKEN